MPAGKLVIGVHRPYGNEHLGYGTFCKAVTDGLHSVGLEVVEPTDSLTPPENLGCVVWPAPAYLARGKWKNQYTVSYTMWETSRLPECLSTTLHNYDLIVVPNDKDVELFSQFNPNVIKIPLGYDHTEWTYQSRHKPDQEFKFLLCAISGSDPTRKGFDLAMKAFELAFPRWKDMVPRPTLTVKFQRGELTGPEWLVPLKGQYSLTMLKNLYRNCHVMVMPSRGEGWGYHPVQALATGMPTILSDIPGHSEYAWLPGFFTIPTTMVKAPPFHSGDGGDWWEPDLDALVAAYLDLYENYATAVREAKVGSEQLACRYTQAQMGQQLASEIGPEHLGRGKTGPWIPFTEREYRTTVTRLLSEGDCNVAGRGYVLQPGQEYWLPASVRTVLKDAGYCANPDDEMSRI